MALSAIQIALRDRIAGLRGSLDEIQRLLWAAERECRAHVYEENGLRARCMICGKDGGWYCAVSPIHVCEYDWPESGEYCIYCNESKERK